MSQANKSTESQQTGELDEKYRSTDRTPKSDIGVSGGEHDLDDVFGDEDHVPFEYDPEVTGRRVAQRYDTDGAAIRELASNAETACLRRIRQELLDAGYTEDEVLDMDLGEARERCRDECGYEPIIEIEHAWPGTDRPALVVRDNGIGISKEEFLVLKKHGYSASAMDGEFSDGFGQGIMSVFLLAGYRGEATIETKSRLDGASYGTRMRINGFNQMPGGRSHCGTAVTIPSFSESAQEISVMEKVDEYCEGMRVPVRYEEYDESGRHVGQEDWAPSPLEDDLPETAPVVTFENEYVRAVASPAVTNDRSPKTFLTSMPIARNDSNYGGTSNYKFDAPWKFDVRLKYEDGRIAFGPNAGLIPVEEDTYADMSADRKEHYIPLSETSTDDVKMPKPVDDRDRLRDGNQGFFKAISRGLSIAFAEQYADVLAGVQSLGDLADLDPRERTLFLRGYSHFAPNVSSAKSNRDDAVSTIVETLEDEVGVTIPDDLAEKLIFVMRDVSVVPRGCSNPSKKGGRRNSNRNSTKIWRVLVDSEPSGSVYMAKTVGEKKCRLAWELDEKNVVIQLEDSGTIGEYRTGEELFGWKKLKDLPSRNLEEEFGSQLSDEFIDRWDTQTSSSSGASTVRGSFDRDRAKKRHIKVRKGRGRRKYHTHTGEYVHDQLDAGESIKAKKYRGQIDTLIVVDQNEHNIRDYGHLCKNNVGQAVVPSYVKEYLLEADNVYEPEELRKEYYRRTVEPDWTASGHDESKPIGAFWSDDVLFVVADGKSEWFAERLDQVRTVVDDWMDDHESGYDAGDMNSFTILEPSDLREYWVALLDDGSVWTSDATLLYTSSRRHLPGGTRSRARGFGLDDAELYLQIELPKDEFDRDADEWYAMFGSHPTLSQTTRNLVEMLQESRSCLDDDTNVFPSLRDD